MLDNGGQKPYRGNLLFQMCEVKNNKVYNFISDNYYQSINAST